MGFLIAQLKKSGRAEDFRIQDVWLAAQAIQRGFKLLTANAKDIRDIPELDRVVLTLPSPKAKQS
jgi:hypothetical protein